MTAAPLFYILGQVNFNVVLDMEDYLSQLQKVWRSNYPDFSQDTMNNVEINLAAPGQVPAVKTITKPRWHFKSIDKSAGYILQHDSISFHLTRYSGSDAFINALSMGLEAVHRVVNLAYTERISVRILDAVVPQKGESFVDYIDAGLLSLSEKLQGDLRQSILQVVMDMKPGQLTSRAAIVKGRVGLPVDLVPLPLHIQKQFVEINTTHAVLDNDFFIQERLEMTKDIAARIKHVKSQASLAFWQALTQKAADQIDKAGD